MEEKNSYIVVLPWMLSVLRLSGNDLLCYALIYGYSQGGVGGYFGSRTHLAESLNISRRAATDVLSRLEDKGFVRKVNITIDGVQRCLFRAVVPDEAKGESAPEQREKSEKPAKQQQRRFTPPTLDEVREYCRQRRSGIDADRFFAYYTANGWVQGRGKPIKDWRAAVVTWERQDKTNITRTSYGNDKSKATIIAERQAELAREVQRADERYRQKVAGGARTTGLPPGLEP